MLTTVYFEIIKHQDHAWVLLPYVPALWALLMGSWVALFLFAAALVWSGMRSDATPQLAWLDAENPECSGCPYKPVKSSDPCCHKVA